MAKEIERKFLVRNDGWRIEAASSSQFLQAYIASGDDRSIRVRIIDGTKARLTVKIGREMLSRDEFEYDIPVSDANELADLSIGIVLEKVRHRVEHKGYIWEIDVYSGTYEGLIVAEVEIEDEKARPELPAWIGREITGDRRYSNLVMATEDLSRELIHGVPAAAR
ncbi:CYTH domain-containing protein [Neorhizobium alkalisoli]|uniref:CYTH domain-containing protein n=1 Tax=Neorhizobium alkalisoli TaxID=528178 RepID=A0A561QNV0_9HYPH|nr:CYTH domain-containing protein [Neorhizobium alkalisoli]TWF52027.1 CYTH domain-containing protein [Neorhizobium alkalisoli]